ncbi:MAG: tetratricopeptide repeat protein [Treponema sp.]|jgi:tetratricopeptide (TPR) repeat protein|nr:tetratricopeptide repeat protein [Treponema sp.]
MSDAMTVQPETETPTALEVLEVEINGQNPDGEEHPADEWISDLSKKGYQLLKENKMAEAADCFSQILVEDEGNNYALVGLGDAARKQGNFKEAVDYYKRCLGFNPENNYALFGLADSFKALNQYYRAIEIWEQYLQHDDQNITVLTRVADAYRKTRDFKRSKSLYLKVLEMEPENHYALIGLGHLHYDFKEYRVALSYWGKVFAMNDQEVDIRVLTSIGNCHRKLRTFKEGVPYFEKALELEPGNFYALFGMADCYRGMDQQHRSLEYWNRILDQDPRNKVILTRAGDAYRNMGEYDKAGDYYRQALNIEFDTYAVLGLAIVSKAQGRYGEAINSLKRLMQQDPRNYRFCIELADCLVRSGEKTQALDALAEFQRIGARNSLVSEFLDKLKAF